MPNNTKRKLLVFQFKSGDTLLLLHRSLKRVPEREEGETLYGLYDRDDEDNGRIRIEKELQGKDYTTTVIHEVLHFVNDSDTKLDDPEDFDDISEFIYNLARSDDEDV